MQHFKPAHRNFVLITLGVILRNISVALKAIEMFCVLIQKITAVKQVEMF